MILRYSRSEVGPPQSILGTKSQDGCVSVLTYSKAPTLNCLIKEGQGLWDCSHRARSQIVSTLPHLTDEKMVTNTAKEGKKKEVKEKIGERKGGKERQNFSSQRQRPSWRRIWRLKEK